MYLWPMYFLFLLCYLQHLLHPIGLLSDYIQETLEFSGFSLEEEVYLIAGKKFKSLGLEMKEDNNDEFSSFGYNNKDFSWKSFIRSKKRQLKDKVGNFEFFIFSRLAKRVVSILDKNFNLKSFNPINKQALEVQDFLEISDAEAKVLVFSLSVGYIPSLLRFFDSFPFGVFPQGKVRLATIDALTDR